MAPVNQALPVPIDQLDASRAEATAKILGKHFDETEDLLLQAYALKEGTSSSDTNFKDLAKALGITATGATVRSLQLIAEQRFQRSSQLLSLFSGLLDKVDQIKQRIIAKFAN